MTTNAVLLLRLNNHPHEFYDYVTIFQACLIVKKYIPRFCYHTALKIAGNCRMCLIEEKSSLKPLASCAITISNGMGIQTETEMIKKAREGVLEYLLINHPLDCPICDQGGECDLQDQTMVFGADRGRFYENKRSVPNKNLGYLIKTFLNRCIHCARCTRFLADLTGTADLQLLGRGLKTEIGTYTDRFITSEVSGNIADLCPVGALTSKPYAFKARPWELVPAYSFDIMDALGSNLEINYRGTEIMRILPRINKAINGEWITDKTRFFYDSIMLQRLSEPYIGLNEAFTTIGWAASFEFAKNSLFSYAEKGEIDVFSLGFGSFMDLETATTLKNFFSFYGLKFSNSLVPPVHFTKNDYRSSYIFNIEHLEPDFLKTRHILLVNLNIRYESPLLNIQIRASQQENEFDIFLLGFVSNTNLNFLHLGGATSKLSILKFLEKNADSVIIVGGQNPTPLFLRTRAEQLNHVWSRVSQLTYLETFSNWSKLRSATTVGFNVGVLWLEAPIMADNLSVSLNFVHHMIDNYVPFSTTAIFWPSKFYLEKISSFVGNVGHFFSTIINIFGFNIRGTKEEHRILRALDELLDTKLEKMTFEIINFAKVGINEKAISLRPSKNNTDFGVENAVFRSLINNYYTTNELCEISPVLGLCAKRYRVMNDYQWIYPVLNKC